MGGAQDRPEVNVMEAVRSAKRSLAESFTGMMRRRASTDTLLGELRGVTMMMMMMMMVIVIVMMVIVIVKIMLIMMIAFIRL